MAKTTRPQLPIEVLHGAQRGDDHSCRQIYRAYIGFAQFICRQLGQSKEDSDDICQHVFEKLFQKLDGFTEFAPLAKWIAVSCRNAVIDLQRRPQKRFSHNDLAEEQEIPVENQTAFTQEQRLQGVVSLLKKLVAEDSAAEILQKFYCQGLSLAQIAATSGCSVSTASSRLSRQRKKFRQRFAKELEEID